MILKKKNERGKNGTGRLTVGALSPSINLIKGLLLKYPRLSYKWTNSNFSSFLKRSVKASNPPYLSSLLYNITKNINKQNTILLILKKCFKVLVEPKMISKV